MKRVLIAVILLLSACGQQKECEENIKELFDSKTIGNCVVSTIKEGNPRMLCYYSQLLSRINSYRTKFNYDAKLKTINAKDILEEAPQHLYQLYRIVGVCNMVYPEGLDVQFEMATLLDDYKNGRFPKEFYFGYASQDELVSTSTSRSERINILLKKRNEKIKNRKIIQSYKQWLEED